MTTSCAIAGAIAAALFFVLVPLWWIAISLDRLADAATERSLRDREIDRELHDIANPPAGETSEDPS